MLRRLSKDSSPPFEELADVTLRRPQPVGPSAGLGAWPARPMGPEFMRRSCTFVAEAGWRKTANKETKGRASRALDLGSAGLGESDNGRGANRVQRIMGNLKPGNMKSWSSSEDVRQSVLGAFSRTVSVINQARRSSRLAHQAIPEASEVGQEKAVATVTAGKTRRSGLNKSASASKFVPPASNNKKDKSLAASRNSVPSLHISNASVASRYAQDKANNNLNKQRNTTKATNNTQSNRTVLSPNNNKKNPNNGNRNGVTSPKSNKKASSQNSSKNGHVPNGVRNGVPAQNVQSRNAKNVTSHNNNNRSSHPTKLCPAAPTSPTPDDHLFKKPAPPVAYKHHKSQKPAPSPAEQLTNGASHKPIDDTDGHHER